MHYITRSHRLRNSNDLGRAYYEQSVFQVRNAGFNRNTRHHEQKSCDPFCSIQKNKPKKKTLSLQLLVGILFHFVLSLDKVCLVL